MSISVCGCSDLFISFLDVDTNDFIIVVCFFSLACLAGFDFTLSSESDNVGTYALLLVSVISLITNVSPLYLLEISSIL